MSAAEALPHSNWTSAADSFRLPHPLSPALRFAEPTAATNMLRQSPQLLSHLQAAVPWAARKTPALGCLISEPLSRNYSVQAKKEARDSEPKLRHPRSLQAIHLKPLKREAQFGVPSCDLQLRSFSLQPLQFFSDFALRAAYYLGLPASGPVTLPRITERWTVPRSHFIFKKSQENFERVTLRRLIQIKDGDPETVQLWLAYLRKHQFYGIGMKANVWEFGPTEMSKSLKEIEAGQDAPWAHLGQTRSIGAAEKVAEILSARRVKKSVDDNFPIHEIS